MKCALNNGYTVIRLLQTDVWDNKNNWDKELKKHIKKYKKSQCIFICKDNTYSCFEEMNNYQI